MTRAVATLIAGVVVGFFSVASLEAQSWIRGEGEWMLSARGSYQQASEVWDEDGKRSSYDSTFHKTELGMYAEYGAQERVSVVGKLTVPYVSHDETSFGLGDLGAGVNLGILHDTPVIGALQILATVPLHDPGVEPPLGYGAAGAEINALIGAEFSVFEIPAWLDLSGGLRYFFSNRWDSWHGAAVFGLRPTSSLGLMVTGNTVLDNDFFRKRNNDELQRRLSLGFGPVYDLSEYTSLTAGLEYDVWGRSVGQAISFHVGTQLRF